MRELQSSDKNVLGIYDSRSDTEMEIYYRTPTPREEALYQAKLVKKRGRKVVLNTHETRLKFGLRIITGFKEGDFGIDGKPFSADLASKNFREDWKQCLANGASDIITTLALTVFEGARPDIDMKIDDEDLGDEDEVVEDAAPLEKS